MPLHCQVSVSAARGPCDWSTSVFDDEYAAHLIVDDSPRRALSHGLARPSLRASSVSGVGTATDAQGIVRSRHLHVK